MIVAPGVEAYGKSARLSLLADLVEIESLKRGYLYRISELEEYIRDTEWAQCTFELYHNPAEDHELRMPEVVDTSEEAANSVFNLLHERQDALGRRYPFQITENAIQAKGYRSERNAYLVLLSISVCHAWNARCAVDPKKSFESVVVESLRARGFLAAGVAGYRRGGNNFAAAVDLACADLQLPPGNVANVLHRVHAHDAGCDVLAHLSWSDQRTGRLILIGQATCANSNEWERKIKEPVPSRWSDYLNTKPAPMPFLAVPYHIESNYMADLSHNGLVLDRIRLASFSGEVSKDNAEIYRYVMESTFEGISV